MSDTDLDEKGLEELLPCPFCGERQVMAKNNVAICPTSWCQSSYVGTDMDDPGELREIIRAYKAAEGVGPVAYSAEERARRRAGPVSVKWPMPDPLAKYREPVAALAAPQPAQSRDEVVDIIRAAIVATAARPPGLRGPYVFDEAALQEQAAALSASPQREGWVLTAEQVEWVVNDIAELGVKIGDQFFFCYKGSSLVYREATHDDGSPMHWRPVFKREFGECIHPINYRDLTKIGTVSLDDSEGWQPLPTPPKEG